MHYTDGMNSNKVYEIYLEDSHKKGFFNVAFSYGKIGTKLKTGYKNTGGFPVSLNIATQMVNKIVHEKTRKKGYEIKQTIPPKAIIKTTADKLLEYMYNNKIIENDKYHSLWNLVKSNDDESSELAQNLIKSILQK